MDEIDSQEPSLKKSKPNNTDNQSDIDNQENGSSSSSEGIDTHPMVHSTSTNTIMAEPPTTGNANLAQIQVINLGSSFELISNVIKAMQVKYEQDVEPKLNIMNRVRISKEDLNNLDKKQLAELRQVLRRSEELVIDTLINKQ